MPFLTIRTDGLGTLSLKRPAISIVGPPKFSKATPDSIAEKHKTKGLKVNPLTSIEKQKQKMIEIIRTSVSKLFITRTKKKKKKKKKTCSVYVYCVKSII